MIVFALHVSTVWSQRITPDTITFDKDSISKIGFGSCFHQDKDYSIWNSISNDSLDLWIWLGDNIYADTVDIDSIKRSYNKLKRSPEYSILRKSTPIIGTWDDHDYGKNDAGKELKSKYESAQASLDFTDVPLNSNRRKHEGIYGSYIIKGISTRIVLLDLRFFKDDPKKKDATILGKEQWKWLKMELKNKNEENVIICSSLQVISNEHEWENWQRYGKQRQKLLKLIERHRPKGTIILSGDRHRAEISKYSNGGLELYDVTSSSLNSPGSCSEEVNSHRIGEVTCGIPNYGILYIEPCKDTIAVELKSTTGTLHTFNLK